MGQIKTKQDVGLASDAGPCNIDRNVRFAYPKLRILSKTSGDKPGTSAFTLDEERIVTADQALW